MDIKIFKQKLLEGNLKDFFFIFELSDNDFAVNQYIQKLSHDTGKDINYVDHLPTGDVSLSLFDDEDYSSLNIFRCDKLEKLSMTNRFKNFIVITKEISPDIKKSFDASIIKIPPLTPQYIKEYAYSIGDGVEESLINKLLESSNYNIYRVDQELSKLKEFAPAQRNSVFKNMLLEGALDDLSFYDIFSLSNAIQSRDINDIKNILINVGKVSIDVVALYNILYQNFKKMILVWLNDNPIPDNTGLKSNQIWAIKNMPHRYSKEQLIKSFDFLTGIDVKIKTGELSTSNLLDYMLVKLLTW